MSLFRDIFWIGCLVGVMGITTLSAVSSSSAWRQAGFAGESGSAAPTMADAASLDAVEERDAVQLSIAQRRP